MTRADLLSSSWIPSPEQAHAEVERRARELVLSGALDGRDDPLGWWIDSLFVAWTSPLTTGVTRSTDAAASGSERGRGTLTIERNPTGRRRAEGAVIRGEDGGGSESRQWGLRLLTALAFFGDVANFYVALAVVGNAAPTTTLLVVLALAAGALGLAHTAGGLFRARVDGRPGSPAVIAFVLALVLVLGATAASVRLASPPPQTGGNAGFFGADTVGMDPAMVNLLLTALLFVLYLASTTMAVFIGYRAPHSDNAVTTRWATAISRIAVDGWQERRARRLRRREQRDGRADRSRIAQIERYRACAESLRYLAAHTIAVALANPGVSSDVFHRAQTPNRPAGTTPGAAP
jgi:hypothetical protein